MCSPEDAVRDITVQCRHHRGRFLLHGQFAFAERTMGNTIDQIGVRLVCKCERRHTDTQYQHFGLRHLCTCAFRRVDQTSVHSHTRTHAHTKFVFVSQAGGHREMEMWFVFTLYKLHMCVRLSVQVLMPQQIYMFCICVCVQFTRLHFHNLHARRSKHTHTHTLAHYSDVHHQFMQRACRPRSFRRFREPISCVNTADELPSGCQTLLIRTRV